MNQTNPTNPGSSRGRRTAALFSLAVAALVVPLLTTGPAFADAEEDTYPGKADAVIEVMNFRFEDRDTESPVTFINAGDTVKWLWVAGTHSATQGVRGPFGDPVAEELSEFDSGVRTTVYDEWFDIPLTWFYHTFEEPGVYQYYCRPHWDQQHGVVVVLP